MKDFTTFINVGTEKSIQDAYEREVQIFLTLYCAYAKYKKTSINIEKIDTKLLHHVLLTDLEDCDKLKPIFDQGYSSKNTQENIKNQRDTSVIDKEVVMKLSAKFFQIVFEKIMLSKEEIASEALLFSQYPNTSTISEFWNITEHALTRISKRLESESIKSDAQLYISTDLLDCLIEDQNNKDFVTVRHKYETLMKKSNKINILNENPDYDEEEFNKIENEIEEKIDNDIENKSCEENESLPQEKAVNDEKLEFDKKSMDDYKFKIENLLPSDLFTEKSEGKFIIRLLSCENVDLKKIVNNFKNQNVNIDELKSPQKNSENQKQVAETYTNQLKNLQNIRNRSSDKSKSKDINRSRTKSKGVDKKNPLKDAFQKSSKFLDIVGNDIKSMGKKISSKVVFWKTKDSENNSRSKSTKSNTKKSINALGDDGENNKSDYEDNNIEKQDYIEDCNKKFEEIEQNCIKLSENQIQQEKINESVYLEQMKQIQFNEAYIETVRSHHRSNNSLHNTSQENNKSNNSNHFEESDKDVSILKEKIMENFEEINKSILGDNNLQILNEDFDCKLDIEENIEKEENLSMKNEDKREPRLSVKTSNSNKFKNKEDFVSENLKKHFSKIMIHIHGGGFMSGSSSYHQNYLRKYANTLKIPIFCVDYRLAPKHKYPDSLHDCIKAYFWIRQFITQVICVKIDKVIQFGDSAGGNQATVLIYWLIENNETIPDLLLLCYPALNLEIKWTPAWIYTMEDWVLNQASMYVSNHAYLPKNVDRERDYYISPIKAPKWILEKLPKTRIIVGTKDCLRDESYRFSHKLYKMRKDIQMYAFEWCHHGVLNQSSKYCKTVKIWNTVLLSIVQAVQSSKKKNAQQEKSLEPKHEKNEDSQKNLQESNKIYTEKHSESNNIVEDHK